MTVEFVSDLFIYLHGSKTHKMALLTVHLVGYTNDLRVTIDINGVTGVLLPQ